MRHLQLSCLPSVSLSRLRFTITAFALALFASAAPQVLAGQAINNPAPVNFGNQPVGVAQSQTSTLFTIPTATTLATPSVLTLGSPNLDYTLGTGSRCVGAVAAGTCTVNVVYTPKSIGARNGAVVLESQAGTGIATGLIYGVGTGPSVNYPGSGLTTHNGGFRYAQAVAVAVAVDGSGDVYVADTYNGVVKKLVAVNGLIPSIPVVNIIGSGFYRPTGMAVDGYGNVYVADNGIKKIVDVNGMTSTNSTIEELGSGFYTRNGVAVDGAGNVYVADINDGNYPIKEIVAVNGQTSFASTVIGLKTIVGSSYGVAVDGSGNVYVANTLANQVREMVAVKGSTSASSAVNTIGSGLTHLTG